MTSLFYHKSYSLIFKKLQETHDTKLVKMFNIYFIEFLAPPQRQSSEKLISRLNISFPSTEIFSKRRKIYALWRETRVEGNTNISQWSVLPSMPIECGTTFKGYDAECHWFMRAHRVVTFSPAEYRQSHDGADINWQSLRAFLIVAIGQIRLLENCTEIVWQQWSGSLNDIGLCWCGEPPSIFFCSPYQSKGQ